MQLETLFDVWNSGARLYARCAWGRREGLKSVRACIGNAELDVASLLWAGPRLPDRHAVQPAALPCLRLAEGIGADLDARHCRRQAGGDRDVNSTSCTIHTPIATPAGTSSNSTSEALTALVLGTC